MQISNKWNTNIISSDGNTKDVIDDGASLKGRALINRYSPYNYSGNVKNALHSIIIHPTKLSFDSRKLFIFVESIRIIDFTDTGGCCLFRPGKDWCGFFFGRREFEIKGSLD